MKRLKIIQHSLLLFLLISSSSLSAQITLKNRLEQLDGIQQEQKIYVFHDKPSYVSGETVWFSTFLVDASFHALNALTQTIYIELLAPDLQVIESKILHSPLGVSWGQFDLRPDLPSGNYILRAYTNFMRNGSPEFFFQKQLPITGVDPNQSYAWSEKSPELRFFAEGGNFLIGIENRVAFKFTDETGRGAEARGIVLNEKDEVLDSISTIHDGMGEFQLNPSPGSKYRVQLFEPIEAVYEMPAVIFSGYSMRVSETPDAFDVFIYRNTASTQDELGIIAQSRNTTYFAAGGKITNSTKVKIPKSKLPAGITQITVFDQNGMPAAERLVFLNKKSEQLQIQVKTQKQEYAIREKVVLSIDLNHPKNDSLDALLSISVSDKLSGKRQLSIEEYLYLQSDLRGFISNPHFYFSDDANASAYADLLMLTHGWRRFIWTDTDTSSLQAFNHERGVPLRGTITRELNNKPVANANLNILDVGTGGISKVKSGPNGEFFSDELVYYDSTDLNIQTANKKGNKSQFRVNMLSHVSPEVIVSPTSATSATDERIKAAQDAMAVEKGYFNPDDVLLLDEVSVRSTRIKNEVRMIFGTPDRTLTTENLPTTATNILDLIRGRFAGVQVSGSPLDPTISIRGGGEPLYLLDGIQVPKSALLSVPPSTIETIDLMKGNEAAIYGSNGSNGVLAFYTRQGYQGPTNAAVGMNTISAPGYAVAREFYSPDYGITSDRHNLPDKRSTLYWNPIAKPSSTGKLELEFYTGDLSGEYNIRVEGIDILGIPGSGSGSIQVQE